MKRFSGLTFFIYIVLVCDVRFAHAHSNPYYELWTNKFESVRLEMQILREKITEGEKQLGETKSKLADLEPSCSANQKEIGVEEKGMKTIGSDPHGIEKKRDEYTILHQAFVQQKLYNRRLGKKLGDASAKKIAELESKQELKIAELESKQEHNIAELESKQGQKIAELESKQGQKIAELESKQEQRITELESKQEQKIADLEKKHGQKIAELEAKSQDIRTIQDALESLATKTADIISKLETATDENTRLKTTTEANAIAISRFQSRGCQTGNVGGNFDQTRSFRVTFDPPFEKTPKFMHALRRIDARGDLYVNANPDTLNRHYAVVRVITCCGTKLIGVLVQWIACP